MNYALPFCRGEIVGVYDAEDRPDPGQIRAVVAAPAGRAARGRLRAGLPRLLQHAAQLAVALLHLEYAIWFRVVLHGVQRLGHPDPARRHDRVLPPQRARADRRLGRAQRHRGRRPRHAARAVRLSLRDDRLDHLGGGELPRAALDQAALALAEGLRDHLGDPHAQAGRALAGPRGRAASWGSRCCFSAAITSYLSLPLFWAIWPATVGLRPRASGRPSRRWLLGASSARCSPARR